jgi:hypothetical protein
VSGQADYPNWYAGTAGCSQTSIWTHSEDVDPVRTASQDIEILSIDAKCHINRAAAGSSQGSGWIKQGQGAIRSDAETGD